MLSQPVVVKNIRQVLRVRTDGLCAFNQLDLMTAKLQMVSGFTLCLGFVLGAIF